MTDDIPRRSRLDKMTPAENAIYNAMCVVEQAGCDVRLTEAVMWLQKARDRVADFVDGVNSSSSYRVSVTTQETLDGIVADREHYRLRWAEAQRETSLAQKRIKSLEDGIVAENRRTSVIEQELQAVKDVLIARDEDFHPEGLVSVAEVVARILNERDRVRNEYEVSLSRVHEEASTATDVLCMALGKDHGRGGLVEHCQKAADKVKELERDFATLAALNKSNADELARQMDLRERGVPAPRFTDSRQQAIAEALLTWRRVELSAESVSSASASRALRRRAPEPAGDLRRAVGRLVVGGYGGSRRDSIALTFANRADVRRDVVLLRDQLAAWLEDRRRTTIFLSGEWRDTSDGDPSGGADVLPDHDDSGGSGAAQADVAQRGQSNEGTHGPLDRPAPPEPAGVHTIRVAWKALPPREQLRCLLSLVEEWGYYGKGLGGSGAATMGDATVGGDETRAPEPAGDCRDVETKLAMSRAELSRTRVAFRNFVGEYERCVPRSARLHPRMVSAEKKLDDLFLHVVEPAEPESVTAKRDSEWVWAMAQALGTNSGLSVPIVPDVEAFRKLFEKLTEDARKKEWLRLFGDLKEVDVAEANGGYCTTCRLLRRICGGEDAHEKEKVEETAGADAEAAAGTDAGGAGGGEGRGRAGPAHAGHESAQVESPARPPKPASKLAELVTREQLVAACKKAGTAYGNVYQTIFEALVKALEDS